MKFCSDCGWPVILTSQKVLIHTDLDAQIAEPIHYDNPKMVIGVLLFSAECTLTIVELPTR